MRCYISLLTLCGLLYLVPQFAHAQSNTSQAAPAFGSCHLFYLTANRPEILPFEDECLLINLDEQDEFRRVRFVGPIQGSAKLFTSSPWALTLELPTEISAGELSLAKPSVLNQANLTPPADQFHAFLTDNRNGGQLNTEYDKVNYRGLSGNMTFHKPERPISGFNQEIEWIVDMEITVRRILAHDATANLTGPPVRIRGTFYLPKYTAKPTE